MHQPELMPDEAPPALHERAFDNLRYIREAMERAGSFTAIPGWGGFAIGITAIAAAVIAQPLAWRAPVLWLSVWLVEASVAASIGAFTIRRKARRADVSLNSGPARRFFVSYSAPMVAAAILSLFLVTESSFATLPGVWLLLYGTSFVGSGAFSIRVIPIMGICFMVLGTIAFFVPLPFANVILALGFGGLHIVFGLIIGRRYGG